MGYALSEKDKDNPDNEVLQGSPDFKVSQVYVRRFFASVRCVVVVVVRREGELVILEARDTWLEYVSSLYVQL